MNWNPPPLWTQNEQTSQNAVGGLYSADNFWSDTGYLDWAIKSTQMVPTNLMKFFFKKENVEYLQYRTISEVKRIKNETVNPQSIDELLIIMRSKFLYAQSGQLLSCTIRERLALLNKAVLEETVKQIVGGIDMFNRFIYDQSNLPIPLDMPINNSIKSSKVLTENLGSIRGDAYKNFI